MSATCRQAASEGRGRGRHQHRGRLDAAPTSSTTQGDKGGEPQVGAPPKDILAELKREAAKANRVYLATDPDREGEAIAWHIEDELGSTRTRTFRIAFNEITRTAVQNALANPGKIDMDRVHAQEAPAHPRSRRGLSAEQPAGQEGRARPQRRPGAVGGGASWSSTANARSRRSRREEYWKITALLSPRRER